MAAHYFPRSWLMTLGYIWFSQHHPVGQLKSSSVAKGLNGGEKMYGNLV
jgi:hypothetical protein